MKNTRFLFSFFIVFLNIFLAISLPMFLFSCYSPQKPKDATLMISDIHSFSKPQEVQTTHISLDLSVDFDKKIISGMAKLSINNKKIATKLFLDVKNLVIKDITLDNGKKATFNLQKEVEFLGQALEIDILNDTKFVVVNYETKPNSPALQWLLPEQTAGKKKPFLFSQSQCILARTWLPCQDSPSVRVTYDARVSVPKDLMALMSAENPTKKSADGVYNFVMKQAIPSYLIALAVGDVEFKAIDARTGVYAENVTLEKSLKEFEDLGKMVDAAEKIYGKYEWERYDLLVLPPSFPFGGMENPRLTFATPTIIAGDKSLTSLIAHELAHSWSGNLVTNETWNDFWLNEGFTVYFERRIIEELYGKDYSDMLALLGYQDLQKDIEEIGANNKDTKLLLDLRQRDPDDGLTEIAYEKGFFFLRTIEEAIGRGKFDIFVKEYFKTFAFQSMNTEKFIAYLEEKIIKGDKNIAEKIKYQDWILGVGLPSNCPKTTSKNFENVDLALKSWEKGEKKDSLTAHFKLEKWSSHEWLHFIRHLPKTLTIKQMESLDKDFGFTKSGNSELQAAWYVLAVRFGYEVAYKPMEAFLLDVGRRKFLTPLYSEMVKTPKNKEMGKKIYEKSRKNYHSVATGTIDALFEGKK